MHDLVLINPPNHGTECFIPLGLHYLRSIAEQNGINVKVLDLHAEMIRSEHPVHEYRDSIRNLLKTSPSRIYGITLWNISYPWGAFIADELKYYYPDAPVIAGGPQATLLKESLLEHQETIDVSVIWEGERVISDLVNCLLGKGSDLAEIPNLCFRDSEGSIQSTVKEPLISVLDDLPELIDLPDFYFRSSFVNIEAGRGCSFRCTFCSSSYIWQYHPRFHSAERIAETAERYYLRMKDNGICDPIVHFEHDNLLLKPGLIQEVLEIKKRRNYHFSFGCSARIDLLDDSIIPKLKESGCRYIYCGIETGSDKMQKIIKKNISLSRVIPKAREMIAAGIMVSANFMAGFPEETLDDLFNTFLLMAELRWIGVLVEIVVLSPELHTPVAEDATPGQYRLISGSENLQELKDAGFYPESYPRECVNHLYALENSNYDLDGMFKFLPVYRKILTSFPLSLFIYLKAHEQPFQNIYGCFSKGRVFEDAWQDLYQLFQQNGSPASEDSTQREMNILEYEINNAVHSGFPGGDSKRADTLTRKKYQQYRQHPELLMGDTIRRG